EPPLPELSCSSCLPSASACTAGACFRAFLRQKLDHTVISKCARRVKRRAAVARRGVHIDAKFNRDFNSFECQRLTLRTVEIGPRRASANTKCGQQRRRDFVPMLKQIRAATAFYNFVCMMHEQRIRTMLYKKPHHTGLVKSRRKPEGS